MPHLSINDITRLLYLPLNKIVLVLSLSWMLVSCGGSSGGSGSGNEILKVSGTISVQRNSDVDLDLNSSISLNGADDPQLIANPSAIGGYLSGYSGTYSASDIIFNEDKSDYYKASLVEGQEIQLSVFQADSAHNLIELDFTLIDEMGQIQLSSNIDQFSANKIKVPEDGLYTLELKASDLTSPLLYTLSLSQTISTQSLSVTDIKTLSQNFIPGEVLLRLKNNKLSQSADDNRVTTFSAQLKANQNTQDSIDLLDALVLKETIPNIANVYKIKPSSTTQTVKAASYKELEVTEQLNILESKIQTLELIKQLNASELVEFAEPNFLYYSAASTDDPALSDQWNLSMLSAPAAWEVSSGQNITIAVLDTGINATHEDLINNINTDGYDFISDNKSSGDGNGFDPNPNDEGTSFHGSHVAGIIAAQANNMKGIAGLAYDSKIMALRVLGIQDSGSSSDIAQAILYAAGLDNDSGQRLNLDQRADIINMSFGGEERSETVKIAIDQAYNQGLILIAAAGNTATDAAFYPASFDNVIGVGAVSNDKKRASFSNFGSNVDLVAPGGTGTGSPTFDGFQDAILSTVSANNYAEYVGTSMAAPHVSAVAALMKEKKPDLNGQSFKAALEGGYLTQNLSNTPDTNNFYGKGLIDAAKSVNWAAGSTIIPSILSIYPTEFGFIGANTKAELSLTNPSYNFIKIISIDSQEEWLNIDPKADVDNNTGLGSYLVEVDLSKLPILGQDNITIKYQIENDPIQQKNIKVFVSRDSQSEANVGNVFVSLYREEDILNNIYQLAYGLNGDLIDGAYKYCINNVAPGRYLLAASTDFDGDRLPFDEGEAFGSFPLVSRPLFIEVTTKPLSNMNFNIQYPAISSNDNSVLALGQYDERLPSAIFESSNWAPLEYIAQSKCSE